MLLRNLNPSFIKANTPQCVSTRILPSRDFAPSKTTRSSSSRSSFSPSISYKYLLSNNIHFQSIRKVSTGTATQSTTITDRLSAQPTSSESNSNTQPSLPSILKEIQRLFKRGAYNKILDAISLLDKHNIQPDVLWFNKVLHDLLKMGLLEGNYKRIVGEETTLAVYEILKKKVKPDLHTFHTLMSAYSQIKQTKNMITYYQELLQFGYTPTVKTYTILINGYGSKGNHSSIED